MVNDEFLSQAGSDDFENKGLQPLVNNNESLTEQIFGGDGQKNKLEMTCYISSHAGFDPASLALTKV